MKKLIAALVLALPFAAANAQTPAEPVDAQAVDSIADPYARFEGMSLVKIFNEGVKYQKKQDYKNAIFCYQYLADQGHTDSQYWTGYLYHYGPSNVKDDDMAIKYWVMASDQNDAKSQFELGLLYYHIEDYVNALNYWNLSLENGLPNAMTNIGLCYDLGQGVDCDEEKALYWFNRAVEETTGAAEAMYNLGVYHELGKGGLTPDLDKAIEWYNKSWALHDYKAKDALERIKSQQSE